MRLVVFVTLAGCLGPLEPEVGPPLRPTCTADDSDPDVAIAFETEIRRGIFDREDVHCTRCHTATGDTPIGLDIGGLDLATYDSLVRGGVASGSDIVRAQDPCGSILVQKVGDAPPFGGRMPLDGPPNLTATDLQILSDWIAEGARDN
ncbi:MAG: hypothetical protein ABI867_39250 [Kofleriaceae bacterium]